MLNFRESAVKRSCGRKKKSAGRGGNGVRLTGRSDERTRASNSRSLRGVQTVQSGLECRRLEDVGSAAREGFARSGGACQPIILIERAENRRGNDTESSWSRVPRRSRIDGKIACRLRDIGSQ